MFTAYDGTSKINSPPINLNFDKPVETKEKTTLTILIERIPWWVYILLPVGITGGIAAFYSYRKVRYGKYEIEQLFLVYNDGRLIAHRMKADTAQWSNEILTGMLTALRGFVKESLVDQSQGDMDEMKYGNLKIAIEQGKDVYLAAFITGYVTEKLKADMRNVLERVEAGYGPVLRTWDGMMAPVEGMGTFLGELIGKPGS
jgi:hypothetical protein